MAPETNSNRFDGTEIYKSTSPDDTAKVFGRSCGITLRRNTPRMPWLLEIRYEAGSDFGGPDEKSVCHSIEAQTLMDTCKAVLQFDMLENFRVCWTGLSHIPMLEMMVSIHFALIAAWGQEIARFTSSVEENGRDWEELDH